MDGWVWVLDWDLCAGLFYEHRFAMLINRGILSKPISHKIKQTQTDGQIIYTFGRLGGKAGGRSKRGRGRGEALDEEGGREALGEEGVDDGGEDHPPTRSSAPGAQSAL